MYEKMPRLDRSGGRFRDQVSNQDAGLHTHMGIRHHARVPLQDRVSTMILCMSILARAPR